MSNIKQYQRNRIESANSGCRGVIRCVAHIKDGEMALRYAAAGFIKAERTSHRVRGYKQLPWLIETLEALTGAAKALSA